MALRKKSSVFLLISLSLSLSLSLRRFHASERVNVCLMGLLSHRICREELRPGDHIYSWRVAYLYAHHGQYLPFFFLPITNIANCHVYFFFIYLAFDLFKWIHMHEYLNGFAYAYAYICDMCMCMCMCVYVYVCEWSYIYVCMYVLDQSFL